MSERTVVGKHVLRNSLVAVVTVAGVQLAFLIDGAVVVESIFSWPGMGRLLLRSIARRDFAVVQAIVVLIACSGRVWPTSSSTSPMRRSIHGALSRRLTQPPNQPSRGSVRVVDYPMDRNAESEAAEPPARPVGRSRVLAQLRANWTAMAGLGLIVTLLFLAIFSRPISISVSGVRVVVQPFALAPHPPGELFVGSPYEGPSVAHPFGTDWAGRDLSRGVLVGGRRA
ncbi:MAG: ABC transporter permease subunit [Natrialbaceae archaeon]|nr:ABC transporter permease subunit [Natrialbaceae archaeon]